MGVFDRMWLVVPVHMRRIISRFDLAFKELTIAFLYQIIFI